MKGAFKRRLRALAARIFPDGERQAPASANEDPRHILENVVAQSRGERPPHPELAARMAEQRARYDEWAAKHPVEAAALHAEAVAALRRVCSESPDHGLPADVAGDSAGKLPS